MASLNATELGFADVGVTTYLYQCYIKNLHTDAHFQLNDSGQGVTVSAHKFVLSLRSPYFEDMFFGKEKPLNITTLNGVNSEDFKDMISFCYQITPRMATIEKICGMYKVAKQFQVFPLMNVCIENFQAIEISPENMFAMLKASDYFEDELTRRKCLQCFKAQTKRVIAETEDLTEISPSMMKHVLGVPRVQLDSLFDLFEWVFAWAKNRYLKEPSLSSTREALEDVLPHLPFASLLVNEFAQLYKFHREVFSNDEAISIFVNYGSPGGSLPNWYDTERRMQTTMVANGGN